MEAVRIKITSNVMIICGEDEESESKHEPVAVEMWYDRHCRHWDIYPVDAEGNQL